MLMYTVHRLFLPWSACWRVSVTEMVKFGMRVSPVNAGRPLEPLTIVWQCITGWAYITLSWRVCRVCQKVGKQPQPHLNQG